MSLRLLVTAPGDAQARVFPYDFDDDRAQILLGRRGGVDVLLPHASVSLVHARIERRPGGYALVDDGSTNGTLLNGARLEPGVERPLHQGDRVGIAEFTLEVAEVEGGAPPSSESSISIARRMVAEVMGVLGPSDQHPLLTVVDGGHDGARLALGQAGRSYVVGSDAACDLRLDEPTVAPRHLGVLRGERGDVLVRDLDSPSGLYVNDQFVAGERKLRDGDVLSLGRVRLRYTDPADVYLRRLEQVPTPEGATSRDAPSPRAESGPPRGERRGPSELAVVAVAAGVAVAALAALVYLWLS